MLISFSLGLFFAMKMEAAGSSLNIYQTARRHIPENNSVRNQRRESLKFHMM
jgi:hypothetical protein